MAVRVPDQLIAKLESGQSQLKALAHLGALSHQHHCRLHLVILDSLEKVADERTLIGVYVTIVGQALQVSMKSLVSGL